MNIFTTFWHTTYEAGTLLAARLAALLARASSVAAVIGVQPAFLRASGARVAAAVLSKA